MHGQEEPLDYIMICIICQRDDILLIQLPWKSAASIPHLYEIRPLVIDQTATVLWTTKHLTSICTSSVVEECNATFVNNCLGYPICTEWGDACMFAALRRMHTSEAQELLPCSSSVKTREHAAAESKGTTLGCSVACMYMLVDTHAGGNTF